MHKLFSILTRWPKKIAGNPAVRQSMVKQFNHLASSPKGRELLARLFGKSKWYDVMLAQSLRLQGNDRGAYRTLMLGQRRVISSPQLHLKLSELYRDNGDVLAAHLHLRMAEHLKSGYNTIRRLTFESDHGLQKAGSETLGRVLEMSSSLVHRHLPMLNRISIYYPEHAEKLSAAREALKSSLRSQDLSCPDDLSRAVETAIANRWLGLALEICKERRGKLKAGTLSLLSRLEKDLGAYLPMLDAAWENEQSSELVAIVNGEPVPLKKMDRGSRKIVELFIPTPFFASPDLEKPTYSTIRQTFIEVIRFLLDNEQVIVVPRFQLYWRQCVPKLENEWVVSYHTFSTGNIRHLHIQESPFAGCCSFDHRGFAGFASIASDHGQIAEFTADVSDEALEENQRAIHEKYVAGNVSKYEQPSSGTSIPGPYVFVALQIPTDIVSQLAWISGTELLRSVVEHYRGTDVRVVVKRHPFCGSMGVQKCLDDLESAGEIIRTENSIHSIITSAQKVFTVNSGVGLEALIQSKTVIVSGGCDYSYAARTVRSREELEQAITDDSAPDLRRVRELLYFYARRFTVPASDAIQIDKRLAEWLAAG